jgi:hypothetical protein
MLAPLSYVVRGHRDGQQPKVYSGGGVDFGSAHLSAKLGACHRRGANPRTFDDLVLPLHGNDAELYHRTDHIRRNKCDAYRPGNSQCAEYQSLHIRALTFLFRSLLHLPHTLILHGRYK